MLLGHARLQLLDALGAMLVASAPKYPGSRIIMRFVQELGGVAESSLVGQGKKTSCVNAALANGTLGYYCDVEPHHVGAILHGLAVVVPTSLAVGEQQRADGKRVLASIVLGVDVAAPVSYALDPVALYNRGFHPSAVCGAFGAAAAPGTSSGSARSARLSPLVSRCSRHVASSRGPTILPSTRVPSIPGSRPGTARRRPLWLASASVVRPRPSRASTTPSPPSPARPTRTPSSSARARAYIS